MNLAEEYFYRHGIKIPFAKHVNHGSMFFRSELADGKIRWKVLNIDSILDNSHPGKYSFKLLSPVHNGLSKKETMFDLVAITEAEWDDYEEYWMKWANTIDEKAVVKTNADVYLTAWEIYAYCYDSELVKFSGQESLHRSLDLSLSSSERLKGCTDILSFLSRNNTGLTEVWDNSILPMIRTYCFWLVELIESRTRSESGISIS